MRDYAMPFFPRAVRLFHTIRYLKPIQIFSRITRRLHRIHPKVTDIPAIHLPKQSFCSPARRHISLLDENQAMFLNHTADISSREIWNSKSFAKLWLYNLHYFDDLNARQADQRTTWHDKLIRRWIDENPPGFGTGWEAYPLSLRIANWIKWVLAGNLLDDPVRVSLAVQCRYLYGSLETHLLGNHLFVNAKALLFGGLFFQGAEADKWYATGLKIVSQQLPEQILADGGHFELSTMYHALFLEDLLDLVNLHRAYNKSCPDALTNRIAPMLSWLRVISHPDGEISFFNDSAIGIAPSPEEVFSYATKLGFSEIDPLSVPLHDLPQSGYSRVALGPAVALIDRAAIGPDYLPAHAHADTLSFELSLYGFRFVVNCGTSVYQDNAQRHLERSTQSHATVVIDDENSSEVWSAFRVARRAHVFDHEIIEQDSEVSLQAAHDGYSRLPGKPKHNRRWEFTETELKIIDRISGVGSHKVEVVLPLHPDIVIDTHKESEVTLVVADNRVRVGFSGHGRLRVDICGYHPGFGVSLPNTKLVYAVIAELPLQIETSIRYDSCK
ncbi:MAG: alginate lyase family protein [Chromatiales bacterium]|jgi:uncharacterized heparinase superfamily protein